MLSCKLSGQQLPSATTARNLQRGQSVCRSNWTLFLSRLDWLHWCCRSDLPGQCVTDLLPRPLCRSRTLPSLSFRNTTRGTREPIGCLRFARGSRHGWPCAEATRSRPRLEKVIIRYVCMEPIWTRRVTKAWTRAPRYGVVGVVARSIWRPAVRKLPHGPPQGPRPGRDDDKPRLWEVICQHYLFTTAGPCFGRTTAMAVLAVVQQPEGNNHGFMVELQSGKSGKKWRSASMLVSSAISVRSRHFRSGKSRQLWSRSAGFSCSEW